MQRTRSKFQAIDRKWNHRVDRKWNRISCLALPSSQLKPRSTVNYVFLMRASGSILPALPMTFTQTPAYIDNSSCDMLLIFWRQSAERYERASHNSHWTWGLITSHKYVHTLVSMSCEGRHYWGTSYSNGDFWVTN